MLCNQRQKLWFVSSVVIFFASSAFAGVLTGKKITVDPGHGGSASGAVGPTGLTEKDVALRIGLYLRDQLANNGNALVQMTRESDIDVSFADRVNLANSWGADRFVSVHLNGSVDSTVNGTETYYYNDGSARSVNSGDLARKIQTRLINALGLRDRGVKTAAFYVLKNTLMPAVLTESAFITNPFEEARLKDTAYNYKIASAHYYGISDHFGGTEGSGGLAGKIIAVDAGYGGSNSGPVGPTGLRGKDVTLRVARSAEDNLKTYGQASVVMTRAGDTALTEAERATIANNAGAHRFVGIRVNANSNSTVNGTETHYYSTSVNGRDLASKVQARLVSALALNNRGIKTNDAMVILKNTAMPAIATYPSFITNPGEEARLKDSAYTAKIGQAIYFGVADHYGVAP